MGETLNIDKWERFNIDYLERHWTLLNGIDIEHWLIGETLHIDWWEIHQTLIDGRDIEHWQMGETLNID